MFASYDGATGASEAISGLAVTDVEVYKGNSITQRASDAGYALIDTDGIDIDGHVGINGFSIDTGDNTDAGFFVAGSFYTVVVASVTADGQTVNFVAGTFRLCATESVAGVVESDVTHFGGTAGTFAAGRPEVNTSHVAGTAQTAGDLKASLNTIDDFLDTEIAGIITTLGTPAGASISADIAAIEAQTDDIGAAGAGLTAVPWNAAWDAEVQSEVADALAVYDPPTHAELTAEIDAVQTDVAAVQTTADAILVDTGTTLDGKLDTIDANVDLVLEDTGTTLPATLDTIDNFVDTEVAAIKAKTDQLTFTVANRVDVQVLGMQTGTLDANAAASDFFDEIWDEADAGHTSADTYGNTLRLIKKGAQGLVPFTVGAGSTTTAIATNLTEATNDHYNGRTIVFLSGVCTGQAATIADYTGATKVITVAALTDAPAENDLAVIA